MDFKKTPDTDFRDIEKLSKEEAEEQAAALREAIAYHDHRYYVKNDPVISDAVYDTLFARLQELEDAFPDLHSAASPTRRIGAPPAEGLARVGHSAPMLSLNAALEESKIRDFFEFVSRETGKDRPGWVLEPKFDGMSVEVVYKQGGFRSGATRGDGETGEDISDNLATVRPLPLQLRGKDIPDVLAVRGEVFLPKAAFQDLNRERIENGEETYANPRNACAGTLRRLDAKIVARWPLDIFFYEILDTDGGHPSSHWQALEAFERWGLKTNPHNRQTEDFDAAADYHQKMLEQRDELSYEIDGIVIKLDDHALRKELGTRHRSPRWAMAWKFAPKQEVTALEKIVVQVGTSGILTPVALLQPVDVGGVTISRATLHNEGEVAEKDLREGDRVRIARAGDVIPEVVERLERPNKYAHKFRMPEQCPSCGTEVVREGAYVLCPAGLSCPAQLRGRLQHYGSRAALDIKHLGEQTADQLVARGLVTTLADLHRLTAEELRRLEGFAEKSARQLHQAIQDARQPSLDRFLYALSIRHVGQRMARHLARQFGTLEKLRNADRDELEAIADVGPETSRSLRHFFSENRQIIDDLADAGVEIQPMPQAGSEMPLEGKTFVFSGALDNYTRDEAQQAVERRGGGATSSVSSQTDYVVVGADPGQKRAEAEEHSVKIIEEQEFMRILEGKR